MSRLCYVNGAFVPEEDAKISVFDRGFLFADGIYEVAAVLDGKLIDNGVHLARLERSVGEIKLKLPVSIARIIEIQKALVAANSVVEGLVYLQVTRGVADRDFAFPKDATSSLVLFTQSKSTAASKVAETGASVVSVPDLRWARRDIKSVALLAQVLAKQAAAEAGCQEAWMHEDGVITEGGSSTAFIITTDGTLIARPNSNAILAGCTRLAVMKLAEERQVKIVERNFTLNEVYAAAEAFYTSASSYVMPVTRVDGRVIGDGKPGPLTKRLREYYLDFARETAS